jgi:hypothetical protein
MSRMFSHLAEILLIEAKMELPMLVNEAKKEVPKHLDGLITDEMRKSFKDKFFPTKTSKLDPKTLEKVMESWAMPPYAPERIRIGDDVSDLAPPASEPSRTTPAQEPITTRRPVRQTRAPAWLAGHALG